MFGFSLRAAVPALVVLSLAGCEPELDTNEEGEIERVELIGEEEVEGSTGTFELDRGGAVDLEAEDGPPASADAAPMDTAGMAPPADSI